MPGVLDVSLKIYTIVAKSSSGLAPGLLHIKSTIDLRTLILSENSPFNSESWHNDEDSFLA